MWTIALCGGGVPTCGASRLAEARKLAAEAAKVAAITATPTIATTPTAHTQTLHQAHTSHTSNTYRKHDTRCAMCGSGAQDPRSRHAPTDIVDTVARNPFPNSQGEEKERVCTTG